MRLAAVKLNGIETAGLVTERGVAMLRNVNEAMKQSWPTDLFELIASGQWEALLQWYKGQGKAALEGMDSLWMRKDGLEFAPLYRHPRKIWGIGLNYVAHAADLHEQAPDQEPASFMKPDTTIIGPGDTIEIPRQSERTTAEAELGVIIGKECKNISEREALNVIAGFTAIIDMTAEDILQKNPRFLTRSKSFDTFFSFGPELLTPDEVPDLFGLKVATVINGSVCRENIVAHMTFNPLYLVAFHSQVMTLLPGDIISTGTPGAAAIRNGDTVECRIDGFPSLFNTVIDLKQG
ncbi:fumarylacetoacetate hydrolase family protein [Ferviditalea candida]|uniref:Fumarylacetoacetate hydrolase family protein n=1 Tax=Ferviditalea candida TaxID=3108399 RepID=A0ABU5ZGC5_9BACL|nr:fumarylacetoacetate hydrolase family protein [Paenibacillaceae bacterium T2]